LCSKTNVLTSVQSHLLTVSYNYQRVTNCYATEGQ